MNKKILAALFALGMVVSYSVPVFAAPTESQLNSELKQKQNQIQQNKDALEKLQDQRQELEEKVEMMDFDIEELMRGIEDTKNKIKETQGQIKTAEEEIKKTEADVESQEELFNKRMRAMYINGVDGYLNILLESEGFSDFLSRIEDVKRIAEADQKIIADLNAKKEEVANKKKALDDKNAGLKALKVENEQKLAKLKDSKEEQAKLIAELKDKEDNYSTEIAESEARIDEISEDLKELRKKPVPTVKPPSSGSSGSTGSGSNTTVKPSRGGSEVVVDGDFGNNIVAFAYKFEGTPYVWGGTTTSGFDCSGFTQYVFKRLGVNLPRVAASQATVGTPVSKGDLQPGDLVFFKKSGRAIHHVGIYVGNGCYIHSPQTGDVVKISDLGRRKDFYSARRIR